MRKISLLVAALLFGAVTVGAEARPLDVHVHGAYRYRSHPVVASYLVRHGLLTPAQAACALLLPQPLGSRRVEHLAVYQTTGTRFCPGAPQPPTYLFDVYVDTVSGVVDTTPTSKEELQTVL